MASIMVTSSPMVAALSAALFQSKRRSERSLSGRLNQPIRIVASPSGMLMANSHGQLAHNRMKPASVGPIVEAPATTTELRPMAVPNFRPGTV